MANPRVEALMDAFRNHFRKSEDANIPVALRQEPVDVVYSALLEEDKPAAAPLTPLIAEPAPMDAGMPMGADLMAALGGLDMGMPDMAAGGMDAATPGMAGAPAMPPSVDDFLMES